MSISVITRRSFLASSTVFASCGLVKSTFRAGEDRYGGGELESDDPIAATADGPEERKFFGDDPTAPHGLLWAKAQAIADRGGAPTDVERARVVIVGSGLSGLTAARYLEDLQPIVLEGASRFGGNAKAHRWGDLTYGIGSAYFGRDTRDQPHLRMVRELNLRHMWREDDPTHDQMYLSGVVHPEFWYGGSDPTRKADFRAAWDYFANVREERYPDIPLTKDSDLDEVQFEALDRRTFADELKLGLGKHLHPHVEDLVRQYCWSAFGADATELSAAAGLNFLSGDLGGTFVLPGGNAAITQALVGRLRETLPSGHLRSSSMVLDVKREADGVQVLYVDRENKLKALKAEACIVCSPKFVAKRLIDDLPPEQVQAISKLSWRAYVVASVLVEQPRQADFHDLYCIAGHGIGEGGLAAEVERRGFTDCTLATWARGGHPSRTVLNLFHACPYDGARASLLVPTGYDLARGRIEAALPPLLKALGVAEQNVKDVRMTRWGHALVFPRPGMLSDGVLAAASAPHGERIFFAQQDNWALPCFESAYQAATDAVASVRKVLKA